MHITYRYEDFTTLIDLSPNYSSKQENSFSSSASITYETWLTSIRNRIKDLEEEEQCMMQIAKKLSLYLHENAITPYNDDFLQYLELFSREEQMKQNAGEENRAVVEGLKRLSDQYEREMSFLKKNIRISTLESKIVLRVSESVSQKLEEIFDLVKMLYALPINGTLIRKQVEGLKNGQSENIKDHEICIDVSRYGSMSSLAEQLQNTIVSFDDNYF